MPSHPTRLPCMRFLFVRPVFCLRLPADSVSQRTPLSLANSSPYRVCQGLSPLSRCALLGVQTKRAQGLPLRPYNTRASSVLSHRFTNTVKVSFGAIVHLFTMKKRRTNCSFLSRTVSQLDYSGNFVPRNLFKDTPRFNYHRCSFITPDVYVLPCQSKRSQKTTTIRPVMCKVYFNSQRFSINKSIFFQIKDQ